MEFCEGPFIRSANVEQLVWYIFCSNFGSDNSVKTQAEKIQETPVMGRQLFFLRIRCGNADVGILRFRMLFVLGVAVFQLPWI